MKRELQKVKSLDAEETDSEDMADKVVQAPKARKVEFDGIAELKKYETLFGAAVKWYNSTYHTGDDHTFPENPSAIAADLCSNNITAAGFLHMLYINPQGFPPKFCDPWDLQKLALFADFKFNGPQKQVFFEQSKLSWATTKCSSTWSFEGTPDMARLTVGSILSKDCEEGAVSFKDEDLAELTKIKKTFFNYCQCSFFLVLLNQDRLVEICEKFRGLSVCANRNEWRKEVNAACDDEMKDGDKIKESVRNRKDITILRLGFPRWWSTREKAIREKAEAEAAAN